MASARKLMSTLAAGMLAPALPAAGAEFGNMNLLKNPEFAFHVFENHRSGRRESFASGNIAFWNTDAWGDIQVVRSGHADAAARPDFAVDNLAAIRPGKSLFQFFTLPEAGLAHGDQVSLLVHGWQPVPESLIARIRLLKLDSADGEWQPKDFGCADQRTFPRQSRGELVTAALFDAKSAVTGHVVLTIAGAEITGRFIPDVRQGSNAAVNTIGLQVEFANISTGETVWVYAPALVRGATPPAARQVWPGARVMTPVYRHIPRTMQKLWKGEPLHIMVMGSSIDRGSGLPFGAHRLRLEALEAPVAVLGAFVYDSRANRRAERRLTGRAAPGDTLALTPPFKARPLVVCHGGLDAAPADIAAGSVTFSGSAAGAYEIIGE